jgi:hypothetical protein
MIAHSSGDRYLVSGDNKIAVDCSVDFDDSAGYIGITIDRSIDYNLAPGSKIPTLMNLTGWKNYFFHFILCVMTKGR